MTGWGGGYVTDVSYMSGYYRQQSPSLMSLACLLGCVASPMPGPDDPVSYLELGCGQGFGALLLAASNPTWDVTGIDFHPGHIAEARAWAAEAGIDNIRFLEADLATLAEDSAAATIPEADFVSLHGVWSWVPAPVQAGIVRLLRGKVKPGGAVHISYNALPAWGAALGMQRLVRDAGRRMGFRSDRQVAEGLKLVQELRTAKAAQIVRSPWVTGLIDRMATLPVQYLAHEYMNDAWEPRFHADVAHALADAKLEWVASADPLDNFPELTLTPEQNAAMQRFDDPLLRELVKDMCLSQGLRHDVFVRGRRDISPAMRDAALADMSLALDITPDEMPFQAEMPAGRAELSRAFYGPITAAMVRGPRRVGDLLRLPDVEGRRDNPAELIGVMLGMRIAQPALRPGAESTPQALRFNRLVVKNLERTKDFGRPTAAASHVLGLGAPCGPFELFVFDRVLDGEDEGHIDHWIRRLGGELSGDRGQELRTVLTRCLQVRLPVLRAQGVA